MGLRAALLALLASASSGAGGGGSMVPRRPTTTTPTWAPTAAAGTAAPAIETGALRCISFYDFYLDPRRAAGYNTTFEDIATWMNCPSFGATPQTVAFASRLWAAGHRQWMLWKVEDTGIWTDPCSKLDCGKVAMSGLVGDWEHRLDRMIATVKTMPHFANRTFGFNLGDELLGEGVPLANLTAVARRIRSTFGHPTFIYWNEAGSVFWPPTNGTAGCAVSCHDIAAIWVAFFSRSQRYRC